MAKKKAKHDFKPPQKKRVNLGSKATWNCLSKDLMLESLWISFFFHLIFETKISFVQIDNISHEIMLCMYGNSFNSALIVVVVVVIYTNHETISLFSQFPSWIIAMKIERNPMHHYAHLDKLICTAISVNTLHTNWKMHILNLEIKMYYFHRLNHTTLIYSISTIPIQFSFSENSNVCLCVVVVPTQNGIEKGTFKQTDLSMVTQINRHTTSGQNLKWIMYRSIGVNEKREKEKSVKKRKLLLPFCENGMHRQLRWKNELREWVEGRRERERKQESCRLCTRANECSSKSVLIRWSPHLTL